MKYLHLVWAALLRTKTRTLLTMLSVVAAFMLFGMLDSVRVAFNGSGGVAGADRMVVVSRLSITQMLPYGLLSQIQGVKGVDKVAYAAWFGGIYQDPKKFFPNFSVGPDFLDLYPEFVLPPEQRKAYDEDFTGAVVGESLAKRHGWKIGDTIPLQATIFPQKGSNGWSYKLDGIFHVSESKLKGQENQLYFHWKYFDEANDFVKSKVGWYIVKLDRTQDAAQVAKAIDALSENSDHETRTQSEEQFNQAFIKQLADIGLIVSAIMGAVFFTLVLLTGNTMAQAVRERVPEFGILKTIGFSDSAVLALVLMEALLIVMIGGFTGLGVAAMAMPLISSASNGAIPLPGLQPQTWAVGFGLMLAIAVVVGGLPALRAMRLKIVDALAGR
jgi:putative ABC transport system permease protein